LRYVVVHPLQATVAAVVTLSEPPAKIGLLNHSLGITAQQLVTFTRLNSASTRVVMTMEFVGESAALSHLDVSEALRFFTHDALDTMLAQLAENRKLH
jgi:hypothetical protein